MSVQKFSDIPEGELDVFLDGADREAELGGDPVVGHRLEAAHLKDLLPLLGHFLNRPEDPGIGFGKTQEDNLRILNELPIITQVGYPVLLGTSRKSVIGKVLDVPTDMRLPGTLATTVLAALAGVSIVRVHDVLENLQAIRMIEAVSEVEDGSYQH